MSFLTSSASVQNTDRMACALESKGQDKEALERFHLVCDSIERLILSNPGSTVDPRFAILSLGNIADIYERRRDTKKSLAFRECQLAFLEHLKQKERPAPPPTTTPPRLSKW